MSRRQALMCLMVLTTFSQGCVRFLSAGNRPDSQPLGGQDAGVERVDLPTGGSDAKAAEGASSSTYDGTASDTAPLPMPDVLSPGVDTSATPADAPSQKTDNGPFTLSHQVVLLIEGTSGGYLQAIELDVNQSSARGVSPAVKLTATGSARARCLTPLQDGRVLVGDGFAPQVELWLPGSTTTAVLPLDQQGAPAADRVASVHGACQLNDGSLLLGEFSSTAGNAISAYALHDTSARFVTNVHHTILPRGSLASCVQQGANLYLAVVDASDDSDGDVVRLQRSAGQWQELDRFDTSVYTPQRSTPIYTMRPLNNGMIYLFPAHRFGGRPTDLLRCPADNLTATGCTSAGPLPNTGVASLWGPDVLFSSASIPNRDTVIFATNEALYHYRVADGQYDQLLTFANSGFPLGQTGQVAQIRGVAVFAH